MKQIILSLLVGGAALFAYSCTQDFTSGEVQEQKVAKLRTEELGKYNYKSVVVPHTEFSNTIGMLLIDKKGGSSNNTGNHGNTSIKAGDKIEILNVTDAQADLGRVLFYDTKLSLNNAISCGSCHFQKLAFADGRASSPGFEGKMTPRNAMSIVNPAMEQIGLFWDNREDCVYNLSLKPVQNHIEMGMEDLEILSKKLAAVEYYPDLFMKAYGGSPAITPDKIAQATNAFLRSFISWESKYDEGRKGNFSNFTAEESRGMKLFNDWEGARCANCHVAPTFDQQWGNGANIGLDRVSVDKGIKNNPNNFRVPSLRNVELTAPYMHDGRFKNLEEVVDHYNEKVQFNPDLDWNLQDGNSKARKLNLTDGDKKALVAFLKTLTDKKFITDPKFSNPFTYQ
jgi:cytochrome c peroxidase